MVVTGLAVGVLVGGVVGRLVMYLLVQVNPEAIGVTSDDGFEMGTFTLSGSLNLLGAGGFLGTFGGVVYVVARHLTFGPTWFRALSVTLGAGLPVGALIVHTDGVDFTLLGPAWLTVGLFVAVPAAYGLTMWLLLEPRLPRPPSWGRAEAVRWLLRAGATTVLFVAALDLIGDLRTLA